jgi:sugar phosphate isomerase/epimerase
VAALEIMEGAMDRSRVRIVAFTLETKPFDLSERGQVEAVCRLARRAGVSVVNVMRAVTKDADLDMRRLRDFHRLAADFGVTLSVEPQRSPALKITEAAEAIRAAGIRITLDVGRMLSGGIPQEAWGPIYPFVSHVHLYDTTGEDGRRQVPWGTGVLKIGSLMLALKSAGYRGIVTAEYVGPRPGDRSQFDPEPELVKVRKAVEQELAYPG